MTQRFGALTPQAPDRAATPPPATHMPWRALWEHGLAALLGEAEGEAARALHRANASVIDTLLLPLTPVEGDAEDLLTPGAELRALGEQLEAIVAPAHASLHPAATAHVRAARQAIDAALQSVPLPAHWAGSLLLLMQLLIARLSRFQAHDLTDAGVLDTLLLVAQCALHLTARPDACPGTGCACRLSGEAVAWLACDWMVIFGSTEGVGWRVHDAVDHRALTAKELLSIERICGPQVLLDYVHASNVVLPSTTLLRLLHQCGTPRPTPERHWPVEALTISMGTIAAVTAERDRARADEIHRLWVVALAQQLALHGDTPDYHAGASWAAVWAVDQRLSTLALHQPVPAPDRAFIAAGLALKHVLRATAATALSLPERMRHRVAAVTWSLRDVHLSDPDVVVKLVRHVAERHRAGSTGEAEERLLCHLLERACTPEHVVRGLCAVLDCPQWFGGSEVTAGHTARRDVARRIRLHVSALGFTAAQLAMLFSHARDALLARGGGSGRAGVEARLLVGFIKDLLTDLGPMIPGRAFAPAPLELLGELPHIETAVLETAARHMAPRGGYEASLSMNVTPGYLTLLHQLFSARSVEDVRVIATTAATTAHALAEGPQEWMHPRARQLMRALMIHSWYFATGRTATETGLNPRTLRTSLIMGGTDATELTLYLGARCTDSSLQEEARSSIHRLTPSVPRHAACLTLATLSAVASNNLDLLKLMMEVHAGHTILVVLHGLSAWLAPGWGCAHDDTLDWPEGDAARATAAEEEERLCETAILLGDAVKDALKSQGQLMIAGARSVMETLLQQPHHKAFALCSLRCLSRLTSNSPAALIAELRVALDAPTRAAVVAQLETHAQQMSYVSVGVEGEDEMEVAAINDPTINIVGYQPPHSHTPPEDEGTPMDTGTTAVPVPPLSDAMETTSTLSLTPPVRRANASSHSRGHAPLAAPSSAPFVQNFSTLFSPTGARSGFISPSPSISGLFGHSHIAAHAVPHTPIDSPARSHGAYTPTAAAVAATTAPPPLQIWSLEGEGEPATHEHDSLLGGLRTGGFGEPTDDFMS